MSAPDSRAAVRTALYTLFALVAFAGNSVLCRGALGEQAIDPSTFTGVRLLSGAVTLLVLRSFSRAASPAAAGRNLVSVLALFGYAAAFSFAYVSLDTGTGALILFGAVQLTMLVVAFVKGERLSVVKWIGVLVTIGGFVLLVLPGARAPSPVGSLLMTIAGVAWGIYTIKGKGSTSPLADTTRNFVRTVPLVAALALFYLDAYHSSTKGLILAAASGAIASGVGYTVWYAALRGLSTTTAAVVQLSVPVIAAAGGLAFMSEQVSTRLVASSAMILGGIAIVVLRRDKRSPLPEPPGLAVASPREGSASGAGPDRSETAP